MTLSSLQTYRPHECKTDSYATPLDYTTGQLRCYELAWRTSSPSWLFSTFAADAPAPAAFGAALAPPFGAALAPPLAAACHEEVTFKNVPFLEGNPLQTGELTGFPADFPRSLPRLATLAPVLAAAFGGMPDFT